MRGMNFCKSLFLHIKSCLPSVKREQRIFEIKRKFFHFLGLSFPLLTIYCDNRILLIISCAVTLCMIVFDYHNLFHYLCKIPVIGVLLIRLLREDEVTNHNLCGLTWLFIGYTIILASYEQYLVAIAMIIFVFCDMASALIGKNFGKLKICGNKTLEGLIAFVVVGDVVLYFIMKYMNNVVSFEVSFLCIALVVSAFVELVSKSIHIDDNFSIPLSFCATYKILENCF